MRPHSRRHVRKPALENVLREVEWADVRIEGVEHTEIHQFNRTDNTSTPYDGGCACRIKKTHRLHVHSEKQPTSTQKRSTRSRPGGQHEKLLSMHLHFSRQEKGKIHVSWLNMHEHRKWAPSRFFPSRDPCPERCTVTLRRSQEWWRGQCKSANKPREPLCKTGPASRGTARLHMQTRKTTLIG